LARKIDFERLALSAKSFAWRSRTAVTRCRSVSRSSSERMEIMLA
jgi:hypothetical protein